MSDSLDHAAHLMWEHDCGAIPVVSENGVLVGIITDRDIAMSAYTQGRPLRSIPVSAAMAAVVYSVGSDATLDDVEALMRSRQVRRVPVVADGGRPVGLISLNDIARHANDGKHTPAVDRKLVETMAAVCEPRTRPVSKRESTSMRVSA